MADSRHPGIALDDYGRLLASRTPGPLGLNDQGDPNARAAMGDTPGPLGVNDHAEPLRGSHLSQNRSVTLSNAPLLKKIDENSPLDSLVDDLQVRALLDVIAHAEGADYSTMVNGEGSVEIGDFTKHPNVLVKVNKHLSSTAAGRYQFLYATWQELKIKDFTPRSQDIAAIKLFQRRKMLKPLFEGDIEGAIRKGNREWASLPDSPYGQPTHSMEELMSVYAKSINSNNITSK